MKFTLAGASLAILLAAGFSFGSPVPAAFSVAMTVTPNPALTGTSVAFNAAPSGGSGGVTYQWDFGDGTITAFVAGASSVTHTYVSPGHYTIRVNAEDVVPNSAYDVKYLTVHDPITAVQPNNSSTILLDSVNGRVWCVNPDQDTVTAITTAGAVLFEIPVGKNPRTLAQAADKTIWVVSQQHPSISILDPLTGALQHVVSLPHGSLPYGICMTPDGLSAYVSFQGLGGVAKYSTASRALLATSTVPASARGISVSGDGRVFVTRFISPQSDPLLAYNTAAFIDGNHGEVVELNGSLGVVRTIKLAMDPGVAGSDPDFGPLNTPPSTNVSRGVPNYLTSMVISPDGRRAWVPSKKDNIQRGTRTPERDGRVPSAETTYRAIVSSIDLTSSTKTTDELSERIDVDNSEMPQAACISPLGDLIFIALQGNNRVQVRDLYDMSVQLNLLGENTGTNATNGLAPQGLVLDAAAKKLYVHNYMGRAIAIFDASAVLGANGQPSLLGVPTVVTTVAGADLLGANALRGKQVFYNASDARMSTNGYISCAGCHLDGGSDMRVFDFTNRGEGFRNTIVLQGRGGTGMGNVHWSANFNEIQDFDNDIYYRFHDGNPVPPNGTGSSFTASATAPFAPFAPLDPVNNNAGKDPSALKDLDRLADYVASLSKVSRSPFRNTDGTLTAQGAAGEAVFFAKNCQKCHKGRNFTDSTVGTVLAANPFAPAAGEIVLHDVGTLKPTSGSRLGGALPGIDTPTLKGVWQSAPYLHDGSAATLLDVFQDSTAVAHFGSVLTAQEKADLVRYMLEIDEVDAPPVDPLAPAPTVTLDFVSTGKPYSLAPSATDSLAFIDRSYRLNNSPAFGLIILRQAEDDKDVTADTHIKITVPAGTTVYIAFDTRATTPPTWLTNGFNPYPPFTEQFVGQTGVTMTYYRSKTPLSGQVTLGGNRAAGVVAPGPLRNYVIIIGRAPSFAAEGPLNKDEWAHDQDADGDGLRDEYEAANLTSPWKIDTAGANIPDEDQLAGSGKIAFKDQVDWDIANPPPTAPAAPAQGGGGGGGGGCGFTGLELIVLWGIARLKGHRRSR